LADDGHPSKISTILGAVTADAQALGMTVTFALGANVSGPTHAAELEAAVKLAAAADVTILALGLGNLVEGEGLDRRKDQGMPDHRSNALGFPDAQQELLEAVRKASTKKVVLAITSSGGVDVDPTLTDAMLQLWYAGEEAYVTQRCSHLACRCLTALTLRSGHGLCDVMFGRTSPSGRLPLTIHPEQYLEGIGLENELDMMFDSGQGRTYRYLRSQAKDARFSFGFGLSFSSFVYSTAERGASDAVRVGRGSALTTVSVKVRNTGAVAAKEIVQLYVTAPPVPSVTLPRYELQGFHAVFIRAGATQTVEFELTEKQLMTVMVDGARQLTKGSYTASVGGHLPDDPRGVGNIVTQTFEVK
jgi:beta-glucosidase